MREPSQFGNQRRSPDGLNGSVAVSRSTTPRSVGPRTAAQHMIGTLSRALRILRFRHFIIIFLVPIPTPLPNVAVHVVKLKRIRFPLPNWMCRTIAVRSVPSRSPQVGFSIAGLVCHRRSGSARIFPFSFGWRRASNARLSRSSCRSEPAARE
jgi:hypothetical protein